MEPALVILEGIDLYQRDLDTLEDSACVGDMIISFQIRLLETKYPDSRSMFILPQTVQFIQLFPFNVVKETLDGFNLHTYESVFLPLADVDRFGRGATHWSLLCIDRTSGLKFHHFDSMSHANRRSALELIRIMTQYLGGTGPEVAFLPCPVQPNSFDCGVYVMGYMDLYLQTGKVHEEACKLLTPDFVTQYRRNLRAHIVQLSRK
jgi:Ulp1 family protease